MLGSWLLPVAGLNVSCTLRKLGMKLADFAILLRKDKRKTGRNCDFCVCLSSAYLCGDTTICLQLMCAQTAQLTMFGKMFTQWVWTEGEQSLSECVEMSMWVSNPHDVFAACNSMWRVWFCGVAALFGICAMHLFVSYTVTEIKKYPPDFLFLFW